MFINILSPFFVLLVAAQAQEHVPCVDWETTAAAFEEAFAQWTDPSCYTFAFNYTLQEIIKGGTKRTVKNGKQLENWPYPEIDYFNEFWYMIQRDCIQNCPSSGAHSCHIEYARSEDGSFMYPSSVDIVSNSSAMAGSDTYRYHIYNVSSLDCSEINVMNHTLDAFVNEPCVDWESTAAQYEEAFAKWEAPACYTLTYTIFAWNANATYTTTVHNGESLRIEGDPSLQTLDDFWKLTQQKCIQDCPTLGAHSCDIEYVTNEENGIVYPAYLFIDQDSRFEGNQLIYRILNVSSFACPEQEGGEGEETINGEEEEESKAQDCDSEWSQARAKWSAPACYEYSVRRVGQNWTKAEESVTIQVRDGKVVTNGSASSVNMTLDDMFALIEEKCITGCLSNTNAFQCNNTYDSELGFPTRIYIDYDELMADEDLTYMISNFVACELDSVSRASMATNIGLIIAAVAILLH